MSNFGLIGFSGLLQLCFDLIEKWFSENLTNSIIGTDGGDLNISGIAAYQPLDGLTELKVVC